jgi:hypothetical protein
MSTTPMIVFDTLSYSKKLRAVGVPEDQAEVQAELQAEVLASVVNEKLVTKEDLAHTAQSLREDLTRVEQELRKEMVDLRHDVDVRLVQNKVDVIKWFLGIFIVQSGLMLSALKFFH